MTSPLICSTVITSPLSALPSLQKQALEIGRNSTHIMYLPPWTSAEHGVLGRGGRWHNPTPHPQNPHSLHAEYLNRGTVDYKSTFPEEVHSSELIPNQAHENVPITNCN